MYSDLLRVVLDAEDDPEECPTADLIADVIGTRMRLASLPAGAGAITAPIGDALAYDAALVRLCGRLDVEQQLDSRPSASTRRTAEVELAARLPSLADALADATSTDASERGW